MFVIYSMSKAYQLSPPNEKLNTDFALSPCCSFYIPQSN